MDGPISETDRVKDYNVLASKTEATLHCIVESAPSAKWVGAAAGMCFSWNYWIWMKRQINYDTSLQKIYTILSFLRWEGSVVQLPLRHATFRR